MNFVADENIDEDIIKALRKNGYHIFSIAEDFPSIPDEEVVEVTNRKNSVLLTADKDFGELIFRRGKIMRGVILIRIFGEPQEKKAKMVLDAFKLHENDFDKSFTVVDKKKIRIKRMD